MHVSSQLTRKHPKFQNFGDIAPDRGEQIPVKIPGITFWLAISAEDLKDF